MKKAIAFLGIAILGAASWYFFLNSHDYQVTFKVRTFPREVDQIIKTWGETQEGSKTLGEHPELNYRNFYHKKALKAIYNGHYITSDRAWHALIAYAKNKDIAVSELPLEVFYHNPHKKGNALHRKTAISMPLKASIDE